MIKEIVQFTGRLPEKLKTEGLKPKEGLHIMLSMKQEDGIWKMDTENMQWAHYSKKDQETSDFLEKCMRLQTNAWMIDTNKCFDTPTKAIHSSSPYCVGFKREHLEGGKKFEANASKKKDQIADRIGTYFSKAFELVSEEEKERLKVFEKVFTNPEHPLFFLTMLSSNEKYAELGEGEYIIFYLDEPLETYQAAHERYLAEKLFNTDKYNTRPDENDLIYGTNNFFNRFNSSMPFLMHQTAAFNISGRISNKEAKKLFEFQQILPRKTLPNPLPVFVYQEELQSEVIGIFKNSGYKIGYKEIVETLWDKYKGDFANYYLLHHQNTKDGLVFNDYDFVAKFEYELKDADGHPWRIKNLFGKTNGYDVNNVFEFQNQVVRQIFNNQLIVKGKDSWRYKYFDDIEISQYLSARNRLNILKFRKAFYEFVYKSKRQAITKPMFDEMMTVSILEDIRLDEVTFNNKGAAQHKEYFNIMEKLNIWFSLYEKFNNSQSQNSKPMASKLADYQRFIADIANGKGIPESVTLEEYAFAAGQVISYVLSLSESADRSYQRLEPFLQKTKVDQLNSAIAQEIARYKHKIINARGSRFKPVTTFVLSFEEDANIKKYLPQLLAGLFADSPFYNKKEEAKEAEAIEHQ